MSCRFHVKTKDIRCKCCVKKFRTTVRTKNHGQKYYREVIKPQMIKDRDVVIIRKRRQYNDNNNNT